MDDQAEARSGEDALRLSRFLPYRLSVLSNVISSRLAERYAREFGLSIRQWRVIAVVGERPDISASEITRATAMDKVAVSRTVASLVERGLLKRAADSNDGRLSLIALSPDGRSVYERIAPLALDYERELVSGLAPEDRNVLVALLDRLAAAASPNEALW